MLWMFFPGGEGGITIGEVVDLAIEGGERGAYLASIQQDLRGEYELAVLLDRDPNKAVAASDGVPPVPSPLFSGVPPNYYLLMAVFPGAKDPTQCYATTATGLSLPLALITVGTTLNIRIEERDAFGNLRDAVTIDPMTEAPAYFDVTFTPADPTMADRAYTVKYPDAGLGPDPLYAQIGAQPSSYFLSPGDPFHDIKTLGGGNGTLATTDRPYLAGLWILSITDTGQHIKGSPMEITILTAGFDIDRTVVYGPGVNFNNSNPGTVRSGVPAEVSCAPITGLFLPASGGECLLGVSSSCG